MGPNDKRGAKPAAIAAEQARIAAEPARIASEPGAIEARPAAIGVTPAAIGVTPGAIEARPAAIGVTPAAIGVTPAAIEARPAAIGVTPAAGGTSEHAAMNTVSPGLAQPLERLAPWTQLLAWRKHYGGARLAWRGLFELEERSGLHRARWPQERWDARKLEAWLTPGLACSATAQATRRWREAPAFFFPPGEPPPIPARWAADALGRAQALREGRFRYFSCEALWGQLGFPGVDWFKNPFTGQRVPQAVHSFSLADFDAAQGDIKFIFEASRFGWTFDLIRAYAASGDARHAETFWQLFDSWYAANPPLQGPHWRHGYELAYRLIAVLWAHYAFCGLAPSDEARLERLTRFVARTGAFLHRELRRSQRGQLSDHAVGEATALLWAARLFPELRDARRWEARARSVLQQQLAALHFEDGSTKLHSLPYGRTILCFGLLAWRLCELHQRPLPAAVGQLLAHSARALWQLQDPPSGRLPNYGYNDSSEPWRLTGCEPDDYRPAIGAARWLLEGERCYEAGPWDEAALWLGLPATPRSRERGHRGAPSSAAPARTSYDATSGGYFTLRGKASWAMIRCHSYRSRPAHADLLHLDLWWAGHNLLRDSGSYRYFAPELEGGAFTGTAAHNSIKAGERDQICRGEGFRWRSAPASRFIGRSHCDAAEIWQGEHFGYQRLASRLVHRRSVARLPGELWLIVDDLLGTGREQLELYWQLSNFPLELRGSELSQQTPAGPMQLLLFGARATRLLRGETLAPHRGWCSRSYGQREPAPCLVAELNSLLPQRVLSLLALGQRPEVLFSRGPAGERLQITTSGRPEQRIALSPLGATPLQIVVR